MNMPRRLQADLHNHRHDANLLLLGFDSGQSSPTHKIYLEYWDHYCETRKQNPGLTKPQLLHKGYKWKCSDPQNFVVTDYHCLPGLNFDDISKRVETIYEKTDSAYTLLPIMQILKMAYADNLQREFIYLQVSESASIRDSFDINLYAADLSVGQIFEQILDVANHLDVPNDKMNRLMPLVENKQLGHISAGVGRDGQEYLTVYYEQ